MSFCISEEGPGRASVPASPARRFVRRSIKPVIVRLSRRLSVTYWPGRKTSLSAILLSLLAGFVPQLAGAAPTGGKVVAGVASVTQPTVGSTQIQQTSQNAIINWQSFSIGAGESVRFVQPNANAIALNRVIGADPSRIFGTLSANGQVFLVNQAGVYFAPGASVDVGGLLATSMNISDADFLARKFAFTAGDNAGAVSNYGQLRGGYVTLAAPQVTNGGEISTAGGTTALAAGSRMALDLSGDRLVSMSVDAAAANAAVVNSGSISADGGKVFMTARSANAVLDTVINTAGIVRASSIVSRGGQIVIDGGSAGNVAVDGTLAASGGSKGGTVEVLGDKIALQAGARIDVSGDAGGGRALVGGDFHGASGVRTASFTQVDKGAVINADARTNGKGGDVAVWADQHTDFAGSISATGGAHGGDGGFVETSGKHTLAFSGAVNTTAAKGATGTLLLDPTDITISTAASSSIGVAGGTFSGTASISTLNVGDLTTALGSSNVVVDTSSGFASPGNITVNTSVIWGSGNSLTLKADNNITANALIQNTGSGSINLNGDGTVSFNSLRTNTGAINIAGNAGGSSRAGSVIGTSIASTSGGVNVRSQGNVMTGSINAGTGTISIDGNGGVAITGALITSNAGSAAIVVNAGASSMAGSGGGGDISVSGGSVSVGASGRATLYTGSIAGSTGVTAVVGAGSGHFRYYSAAGIDNFSAALGTGVYAVYRESPTLAVTGNSPSIIYGAAAPALSFAYTGLANGDSSGQALSSGATVSANTTNSSSGHVRAGTYAVTPAGAVDQLGYSVAYVPGTLVVAQKALTSSGSTAAGKTYDGTTTATVNTSATTFAFGAASSGDGKAYNSDVVSVNHAALASGAFGDKNAGANKTVTISGITLQGTDATNYAVTGTAVASITPKALTASASAPDKVYDGTTTAAPALTLSGLVGSEALGVSGTGAFNSKDVLAANTVTVNSTALSNGGNGGLASNYTLGTGQTAVAHIMPKALAATATAPNKTYDGTVNSTAVMSINAAGFIGTETVSATGSGTFNSKDVLGANLVTVNSVALANGSNGGLASNYSLGSGQSAVASITPKALTASLTGADKTYDGTTAATATLGISAGLVGAEIVSATGNAAFNSKDVASANQVTVTAVALADGANGGIASNYSLSAGQTVNAHITPKSLTATAIAPDKIYDGSIGATTSLNIASGLVGSETVNASGSGTFNSKDVASANQVTVNSVALADGANGGIASNYSLAAGQTVTAHITPKSLTATATAPDKTYDGSIGATTALNVASGLVGSETVAASGSGTFNSKDVLSANQVTVNSVALADGANGGIASNYSMAAGQTAVASITPKSVSVSGLSVAASKVYDATTNATVLGSAALASEAVGSGTASDGKVYSGDGIAVAGTATGAYNSKNVAGANSVIIGGLSLSGPDMANYTLTVAPFSAVITAKLLSMSGLSVPANKTNDGTTNATVSGTAVLAAPEAVGTGSGVDGKYYIGDTVAISGTATGTYNSADVNLANTVTFGGLSLTGDSASNYSLNTVMRLPPKLRFPR